MELYQAYTDYHGMMDLTENLYRYVAEEVLRNNKDSATTVSRWILASPLSVSQW